MQLCSGPHSATVCNVKSLASKFSSRHTNLLVKPHLKVFGCDTAESGKYLQAFRMNLLLSLSEYYSALKMETAGSLERCQILPDCRVPRPGIQ
jgi:hypothetical protein